ncbi:MAG TPA: hypothetical protein VKV04_14125 [Verrucomicrobiae bacterium]|nr:hypothetical protein [Verrucomicrobiae bacterium]
MRTEKKQIEYLKSSDAIEGIIKALEANDGQVSTNRYESVDSHLRLVLQLLGYRPTETADKKATVAQLAEQTARCLKAEEGKISESVALHVQIYLHATHSNLTADVNLGTMPLKDVPAISSR